MNKDLVIAKFNTAGLALAEAKTIQATKKLLDVAGAAETYAKRQQLGDEAVAYAHSVKIEALAQLGDMLKSMEKNKGTRGQLAGRSSGGSIVEPPEDVTPTLAELGIDKKTSMIAQRLATMPEEIREKIAKQEKTKKAGMTPSLLRR